MTPGWERPSCWPTPRCCTLASTRHCRRSTLRHPSNHLKVRTPADTADSDNERENNRADQRLPRLPTTYPRLSRARVPIVLASHSCPQLDSHKFRHFCFPPIPLDLLSFSYTDVGLLVRSHRHRRQGSPPWSSRLDHLQAGGYRQIQIRKGEREEFRTRKKRVQEEEREGHGAQWTSDWDADVRREEETRKLCARENFGQALSCAERQLAGGRTWWWRKGL